MELSREQQQKIGAKIIRGRLSILSKHGFYGVLLMQLKFALNDDVNVSGTDMNTIYFNPEAILKMSDSELEFMLMHEIMHIALQHGFRGRNLSAEQRKLYNIAADIVINSNILAANNFDEKSITYDGNVSIHLTLSKKEGYLFTTEQVYKEFCDKLNQDNNSNNNSNNSNGNNNSNNNSNNSNGNNNSNNNSNNSNGNNNSNSNNNDNGNDNDNDNDNDNSNDNSNDDNNDNDNKIESMLIGNNSTSNDKHNSNFSKDLQPKIHLDDHSRWDNADSDLSNIWDQRIVEAYNASFVQNEINANDRGMSNVPMEIERHIRELKEPKLDWRIILQDFIQQEINDYSFNPPDKRYVDFNFFLPDFNEKEDSVKNILFMIDTSGSIRNEQIDMAYSEIKGAIDQFNGKIKGKVGFFDSKVYSPQEFDDVESLLDIKPKGGGGTNFFAIFKYIKKEMQESLPEMLIILTDGYAEFPSEMDAHGLEVLWLIIDSDVTPPWGRIASISSKC